MKFSAWQWSSTLKDVYNQVFIVSRDFCIISINVFLNPLPDVTKSSHWSCFINKVVLKKFTEFTGKHLCRCPFSIKLQVWGMPLYYKRDTVTDVSLRVVRNFFVTSFSQKTSKRLLQFWYRKFLSCISAAASRLLVWFTEQKHMVQNITILLSPWKLTYPCHYRIELSIFPRQNWASYDYWLSNCYNF